MATEGSDPAPEDEEPIKDAAARPDKGDREAERKRKAREKDREFSIPWETIDWTRRRELEADTPAWLSHYIPWVFDGAWTNTRIALVEAIEYVIQYGGKRCVGGYRGCGKTKIAEGTILKKTLEGVVRGAVLVAANDGYANKIGENIRLYMAKSHALLLDYPEAVVPILDLKGSTQRANGQRINGVPTNIKWTGNELVLPEIEDSRCSGAYMLAKSLGSAGRGIAREGQRIDVALFDDPDEDGESNDQTDKKIDKITRVYGRGGGSKRLAMVALCNTPRVYSFGFQFSDPEIQPAWAGKRLPFVISRPDDDEVQAEMHQEYITLRKENQIKIARSSDKNREPRIADDWFIKHQKRLTRGWEFSDSNGFYGTNGADGRPLEVHPLHHYLNVWSDDGISVLRSEYDMDPSVEELDEDDEQYTKEWFESRVCPLPRGEAHKGSSFTIATVDVGKYYLHWELSAYSKDMTSNIVDYGVEPTGANPDMDDGKGLEHLICEALERLFDFLVAKEVATDEGDLIELKSFGVDAGYKTDAIFQFKRNKGHNKLIVPLMGTGDALTPNGMKRLKGVKDTTCIPGFYQESRITRSGRRIHLIDTSFFLDYSRTRYGTSIKSPGSRRMFKPDRKDYGDHSRRALHMTAEQYSTKKGRFVTLKKNNHWSDSDYYNVALAIRGGAKLQGVKMQLPSPSTPTARVVQPVDLKKAMENGRKKPRR